MGWRVVTILVGIFGFVLIPLAQTTDTGALEAALHKRSAAISQIHQEQAAGELADQRITDLIEQLLTYSTELSAYSTALGDAAEIPSGRLDELGPAPADAEPAEAPSIAELRKLLMTEVTRLEGLRTEASLLIADIDRSLSQFNEQQLSRRVSILLTRTSEQFSSTFWSDAARQMSSALEHLSAYLDHWRSSRVEQGKGRSDIIWWVGALLVFVTVIYFPGWWRWGRVDTPLLANPAPTSRDKLQFTATRVLIRTFFAGLAGLVIYEVAAETGLLVAAAKPLAYRLWAALTVLVFMLNFTRTIFSAHDKKWRWPAISSAAAGRLTVLLMAMVVVYQIDQLLAAGFQLVAVNAELVSAQTILMVGTFTTLSLLFLRPAWWQAEPVIDEVPTSQPTESTDPATDVDWFARLRAAGHFLALLTLGTIILGYLAISNFVYQSISLLVLAVIFIWLIRGLARWGLRQLPGLQATQQNLVGNDATDPQPTPFWLGFVLDLNFIALSIPIALLAVGFDRLEISYWSTMLLSDIHIGAITISFTDIFFGLATLLIVMLLFRWLSRVVDKQLLPHTRLEPGAQDAVLTLLNYVGVVVALLIALPIIGINFKSIAIIAGALSVGIGFGLQGIVSNFVSGLIMLFERPVKRGDWVVLPSGEGTIVSIRARATEIMTFDHCSMIVPNSEMINSTIENWTFGNRMCRIRVAIGVDYNSDPKEVSKILLKCANEHTEVLKSPKPNVLWLDFGDNSIDFELRAYISDANTSRKVPSELRFAIFDAFKEAGISIPFPQRDVHVVTPESV
jgi:potassium efflux system protein